MANTQQSFDINAAVGQILAAVREKAEAEAVALTRKKRLLNPKEAGEFLGGVSPITLAIWRCRKRYALPYTRIGNRIFYELKDLENFQKRRKVHPRPSRRAKAA